MDAARAGRHRGRCMITIWRSPADLEGIIVAPDFRAIVPSARLPKVLRTCLSIGAVSVAAVEDRTLLGYATVVPGREIEAPWTHMPDLCELGAIEVAPSVRRQHVGTSLLARLGDAWDLQRSIMIARGFVWHWPFLDLGMSVRTYRQMLVKMLGRVGFAVRATDDPEVADHPMNFLAMRIGDATALPSLAALVERETNELR